MGSYKNGIESEEKIALFKYVWLHSLLHHGWEKLGLQVTTVNLADYVVSPSLSPLWDGVATLDLVPASAIVCLTGLSSCKFSSVLSPPPYKQNSVQPLFPGQNSHV